MVTLDITIVYRVTDESLDTDYRVVIPALKTHSSPYPLTSCPS